MSLRIEGLSGLAQTLVVTFADVEGAPLCPELTLETVQAVQGFTTQRWERDGDAARSLDFDALARPEVVAIAFTEDAEGRAIQLACRRYVYADLETPFQTLVLSRVE